MKLKNNPLVRLTMSVHPCLDNIAFLDWICRKKLQFWFFRVLRFGFSPELLSKLAGSGAPLSERSRLHTLATSYLRAGNTVKTTGMARTNHADQCVLDEAGKQESPRLLEVGVSDGSSALGLIEKRELFSHIALSDRYPYFMMKRNALGCRFYDVDGQTHGRKVLGLLINPINPISADVEGCTKIQSINPALVEEHGIHSIDFYDVFSSVESIKYDIIKCSNLLNLIYFDAPMIVSAVSNLLKSLNVGGCLIISHNNAKYTDGEAVICLRQISDGKVGIYHEINDHELLDILKSSDLTD